MRNKKGLATSILALIILLFIFALGSLIALTGWNLFNDSIQTLDNESVSQPVKDNIEDLGFVFGWGDSLFVLLFIALFVGFMITSFTLPTSQSVYVVLYFVFLIFSSIIAMILSNGWAYLISNPNFVVAAASLPFTTWFLTYLPYISFFIGLAGAIIFYARKKTDAPTGDAYNVDFGSGGGDF